MTDERKDTPAVSLRDELRQARKAARRREREDFAIPGYNGRLWGTFQGVDEYSEVRRVVTEHQHIPDEGEREVLVAADVIAMSCVELFALRDGEKIALDVANARFCPEVAAYLVVEEDGQGNDVPAKVDNDRQAVLTIIPTSMDLMDLFVEVDKWLKASSGAVDGALQGNSGAPSS